MNPDQDPPRQPPPWPVILLAALAFTGMVLTAARSGGARYAVWQIAETLVIITALFVLLRRRGSGARRTLHRYARTGIAQIESWLRDR